MHYRILSVTCVLHSLPTFQGPSSCKKTSRKSFDVFRCIVRLTGRKEEVFDHWEERDTAGCQEDFDGPDPSRKYHFQIQRLCCFLQTQSILHAQNTHSRSPFVTFIWWTLQGWTGFVLLHAIIINSTCMQDNKQKTQSYRRTNNPKALQSMNKQPCMQLLICHAHRSRVFKWQVISKR